MIYNERIGKDRSFMKPLSKKDILKKIYRSKTLEEMKKWKETYYDWLRLEERARKQAEYLVEQCKRAKRLLELQKKKKS